LLLANFIAAATAASEPLGISRCEVIPLTDHQTLFTINGEEKVRWHSGERYPRPFFYPFNGPSGTSLTRMGHPGAPDHDHHRSIWFAHQNVNGVDFWTDNTTARIRQKQWLSYHDGADESIMASLLGWYDGEGRELMEQELVAAVVPQAAGQFALELQLTMRSPDSDQTVTLEKTNFGFLAVRVAKTLSAHFGGGILTSSQGETGEADIFGNPARWMDYSGPVAVGTGEARRRVIEGITYFDHPHNPRYPTHWHVRDDGWMGASFCMLEGHSITSARPLVLRYLLYAHAGPYEHQRAETVHRAFAARAGFIVTRSDAPHHQFDVRRAKQEN
jgi:hypothetical protein